MGFRRIYCTFLYKTRESYKDRGQGLMRIQRYNFARKSQTSIFLEQYEQAVQAANKNSIIAAWLPLILSWIGTFLGPFHMTSWPVTSDIILQDFLSRWGMTECITAAGDGEFTSCVFEIQEKEGHIHRSLWNDTALSNHSDMFSAKMQSSKQAA